jgi:Flp pilus assembly pilin Flp
MSTTVIEEEPQMESGHWSRFRDEEGLTTAEYAVGTVAVAGLGGVLIKLLTSEAVRDLIWQVVQGAFSAMLSA